MVGFFLLSFFVFFLFESFNNFPDLDPAEYFWSLDVVSSCHGCAGVCVAPAVSLHTCLQTGMLNSECIYHASGSQGYGMSKSSAVLGNLYSS